MYTYIFTYSIRYATNNEKGARALSNYAITKLIRTGACVLLFIEKKGNHNVTIHSTTAKPKQICWP